MPKKLASVATAATGTATTGTTTAAAAAVQRERSGGGREDFPAARGLQGGSSARLQVRRAAVSLQDFAGPEGVGRAGVLEGQARQKGECAGIAQRSNPNQTEAKQSKTKQFKAKHSIPKQNKAQPSSAQQS